MSEKAKHNSFGLLCGKTYKGQLRLQPRTCPKLSIQQLLISTLIGPLITQIWVSFESLCFLLLKHNIQVVSR